MSAARLARIGHSVVVNQLLWSLVIIGICGVAFLVLRATRRTRVVATRTVSLDKTGEPDLVRVAAAVAALRGVQEVDTDDESCEIRARTGLNPWSFGEDIVAEVDSSGASVEITISSSCRIAMTAFDWGKNRRNVTHIAASLTFPGAPVAPPLRRERWVTEAEAEAEEESGTP